MHFPPAVRRALAEASMVVVEAEVSMVVVEVEVSMVVVVVPMVVEEVIDEDENRNIHPAVGGIRAT